MVEWDDLYKVKKSSRKRTNSIKKIKCLRKNMRKPRSLVMTQGKTRLSQKPYIKDYRRKFENRTSEGKSTYTISIPKILKFEKSMTSKITHKISAKRSGDLEDQSQCVIL